MAKPSKNNLIERLKSVSGNYQWKELVKLFTNLGYKKIERGGSRVAFYHPEKDWLINIHKPHPEKTVGKGLQRRVIKHLKEKGVIDE